MSENNWNGFWSWYVHSGRTDGRAVSATRRMLSFLLGFAVIGVWYGWTSKKEPMLSSVVHNVFLKHPLFAAGISASFALMSFRGTALDYMAARIYESKHLRLRRSIFSSEGKLRKKYEEAFGKDGLYKAPERLGAASMLVFVVSSLALVFSSR